MRLRISTLCVLVLLLIFAVGCGGSKTTTTIDLQTTTSFEETTSTQGETTTSEAEETTTSLGSDLGQITAALAASDKVASDFEISGSLILGDWAGVIVTSSTAEDVRVLLRLRDGAWSIVALGSTLSASTVTAVGAPQEIADFLGGVEKTTTTINETLTQITAALQASPQVAENFTITKSKVSGKWAGVIVHAPNIDDAHVLLFKSGTKWDIAAIGTDLSRGSLIALGAPQSIADFIGYASDLSDKALLYAKKIGGVSHEGDKFHLIMGPSTDTEAEAQALLDDALPRFGDMQSYFIIQLAENFDGLVGTYKKYILIEVYSNPPAQDSLDFAVRIFADPAVTAADLVVEQATANTWDPIPVYEDQTGL
jgi:hypothetical protein